MAGPDPAAMKKGEEMGKSVSKPVARFIRGADLQIDALPLLVPGNLSPTPFFNVSAKGVTKKFEIVVGTTTAADGAVIFTLKRWRAGVASTMKSFPLGAWAAGLIVSLGTDEVPLEEGDVFTIEATSAGKFLPGLMLFITLELG